VSRFAVIVAARGRTTGRGGRERAVPEVDRPTGVIVGHGELAAGMVDAVRRIAGEKASNLSAVSNDQRSPEALREAIESAVAGRPAVLFVDLGSGSCGAAALGCCRGRRERVVVAGVNLAMLLDFVFAPPLPLDELAERLTVRGRSAVAVVGFARSAEEG